MIEVRNLCKQYGDHLAVDDLSFTLEDGKIYGLLGPNGAGKSTTMNIMTGYISATAGEVKVNGHDILTEPEAVKGQIGYLPEIPPLYPEMTIFEYLLCVAEMKKIPRKARKNAVQSVMERVGVTGFKDRLIRSLSKGYRQRVGIAQALLADPKIIILDEPTVGLDPQQILEIRALIRELREEHTVILSSHILSEIAAVCDDLLIISGGRLLAAGSAGDLEKKVSAHRRLCLTVEADEETIREALARTGLSAGVSYTMGENADAAGDRQGEAGSEETAGNSMIRIEVVLTDDTDPRRELFFAFAEHHCPILEMGYESMSLEEIFLKITQEEERAQ